MRYVAAYLLAVLGGKASPSAEDVQAILESIGIDVEDEKLQKVISELNGKDINQVIRDGLGKLASIPSGAPASAAAAPAAAAPKGGAPAPAADVKKETKKEEKKEEKKEDSDEDMGFGLFD